MTKKVTLLLMIISLIFSPFLSSVSANEADKNLSTATKEVVPGLTIEIYNDGRVAPVENAHLMNEQQLDLILKEIGYSEKLIKLWDMERKQRLATYGGEVVDTELTELKHEYISNNGNVYEVTPSNSEKIRDLQLQDLKELGVNSSEVENYNVIDETKNSINLSATYPVPGAIQDGSFFAMLSVAYVGETSTQYEYVMIMDYYWNEIPKRSFGDSAGLHWAPYGMPVANTATGMHAFYHDTMGWVATDHQDIDVSSNHGVTSDFMYIIPDNSQQHSGFLEQTVMISKDRAGEQLTVSGAYAHPWFPNNWTISVGAGGLSIDGVLDELGNYWSWRYNFICGPY